MTELRKIVVYDADGIPLSVDAVTETLQTIQHEHHEIHGGSSFHANDAVDLANGATRDILIITPDTTKYSHFIYEIEAESEIRLYLYEDPTTTADGTPIVAYNRNRNSGTAATLSVFHTPTVTAIGTVINGGWLGSGKSNGGNISRANEWILKRNTKYLLRATNQTGVANHIYSHLNWYEHINKH